MPTKEQAQRIIRFAKYLRKPSLKQAKGALRDNNGGRCCLGHACDYYKKVTHKGSWKLVKGEWFFGKEKSYLPVSVRRWFGIKTEDPVLPLLPGEEKYAPYPASEYNDNLEEALPVIADRFELLGKQILQEIKTKEAKAKSKASR